MHARLVCTNRAKCIDEEKAFKYTLRLRRGGSGLALFFDCLFCKHKQCVLLAIFSPQIRSWIGATCERIARDKESVPFRSMNLDHGLYIGTAPMRISNQTQFNSYENFHRSEQAKAKAALERYTGQQSLYQEDITKQSSIRSTQSLTLMKLWLKLLTEAQV